MELAAAALGTITGWDLVRKESARQIETGRTTEAHYRDWIAGRGGGPSLAMSWKHYGEWRKANPGKPAPRGVNRIRSDEEFLAWTEEGFPDG